MKALDYQSLWMTTREPSLFLLRERDNNSRHVPLEIKIIYKFKFVSDNFVLKNIPKS